MAVAASPAGTNPAPSIVPGASSSGSSSSTPALNFPSTTSTGSSSTPATGAAPSIMPTVGSTDPTSSANTPIPGSTASTSGVPALVPGATPAATSTSPTASGVIPNAQTVPVGANPTVAPVSASETVDSQLNKDLSQDNPLMQLAESQSLAQASARGMQNSSIAAGAGEAAAIGAMLPVAQQDASTALTTQQANLSAVNAASQIQEQGQETILTQTAQILNQQKATMAEQQQQGAINYTLQAQTEAANINQILTQGTVNSMLSTQQSQEQIQQIDTTSANTIAQISAQASANASQDGPALQAQYLTGVTNIMNATAAQIQQIYQTSGLSATQQQNAVAEANRQMQENINNLSAYYASSPLWDTGQQPAPIPSSAIPKAPAPTIAPTTPASPTAPKAPTVPTAPTIPLPFRT